MNAKERCEFILNELTTLDAQTRFSDGLVHKARAVILEVVERIDALAAFHEEMKFLTR